MIKNDVEYRTAQTQRKRLEHELADLQADSASTENPVLRQAEQSAVAALLADLQAQLDDYEALQAGTNAMAQVKGIKQ